MNITPKLHHIFAKWLPLSLCLFPLLAHAAAEHAAPVQVDGVIEEPMSQTVPVLGRLTALQSGVVAARVAGPVASLKVEVGNDVQQDTVLAELDKSRQNARVALEQAQLKEAQARLATARASERLARKELARLEKIRHSPAFTESLYDNQLSSLEVAQSRIHEVKAEIARRQANLELVKIELRDSTIRAPFPGVVNVRHTSAGAWLALGDPVVTLINHHAMEVEADVPADRLNGLQPGQSVRLQVKENGHDHQAVVRAIIPDENAAARTRPVRFKPVFDDSVDVPPLAVNQSVLVWIPAGENGAVLTVHKDAVLRKADGAMVFVAEDGVAQMRKVELGAAVGNRLQVLAGLQADEQVVTRGNERLRPGQAIAY